MIYAETPRLILRSLDKTDLPRMAELIGVWDVARWLASVPYPYSMQNAEEFYVRMCDAAARHAPEYFLLQTKQDHQQIGAIGLHPAREPVPHPGQLVIGYWLGQAYWQQGLMTEALAPILKYAFARPDLQTLVADTDLDNHASQALLRKSGFATLGIAPRPDLRGGTDVMCWQLTRAAFEQRKTP